jgi:hypothetical protein
MASYGLSAGLGGGAFLTHSKAALLAVFSKVQRSTTQLFRRDLRRFHGPSLLPLLKMPAASLAQESVQRSLVGLFGVFINPSGFARKTRGEQVFKLRRGAQTPCGSFALPADVWIYGSDC